MAALRLILFVLALLGFAAPTGARLHDGRNSFVYDFANQPTATTGLGAGSFVYDGDFRRVKSVRAGKTAYTFYSRVTGGLIYRFEDLTVFGNDRSA